MNTFKFFPWFLIGQLVDGVLTSDSDALLYGARTVYRDLEAQNKARSTYSSNVAMTTTTIIYFYLKRT